MAESIVTDWLSDYSSLQQAAEIRTFAAQHENNHEISISLFTIFNERLKYPDLVHSVCNQLYSFYRLNEPELKRFTLQFVPTLIYIYLNSVAQGDKRSCRSVETLLLSIYNIEVSNEDGRPKVVTFRMPILAQASVYHEEKSLNASDLRRWEENSNKDVNWGPLPQIEMINAQNRLKVMTALLFVYNQQLSLIQKSALYHLCRVSTLMVNQGFTKIGHAHRSSYGNDPSNAITPKPLPRIPISSQFLLELLHAVYFAMFNEFASIAIQTVEDIHQRACYELLPEVILVTNAIKNSLHANPSGQPCDGPMGISVALTPATTTVTVSKSMITNASFRTKKLPDDIPIQGPKDDGGSAQLLSITEEYENETQLGARINTSLRSSSKDNNPKVHKVPFAAFKKSKDKDKDKDGKSNVNKNTVPVESNNNTSNTASNIMNKDSITKSLINKKDKIQITGSNIITTNNNQNISNKSNLTDSSVTPVIDGSGGGGGVLTNTTDKISPVPLMKRKSGGALDNTTINGPISNLTETILLKPLTNGNVNSNSNNNINTTSTVSEEQLNDSFTNSIDLSAESFDTSSDISSGQQRGTIVMDHKTQHNSIQISQV